MEILSTPGRSATVRISLQAMIGEHQIPTPSNPKLTHPFSEYTRRNFCGGKEATESSGGTTSSSTPDDSSLYSTDTANRGMTHLAHDDIKMAQFKQMADVNAQTQLEAAHTQNSFYKRGGD